MIERRCSLIDRRSGKERRQVDDSSYFLKGGIERRSGKDRRSDIERRVDWVRINKWYSLFPWEPQSPPLTLTSFPLP
jgi:hypothetical protein